MTERRPRTLCRRWRKMQAAVAAGLADGGAGSPCRLRNATHLPPTRRTLPLSASNPPLHSRNAAFARSTTPSSQVPARPTPLPFNPPAQSLPHLLLLRQDHLPIRNLRQKRPPAQVQAPHFLKHARPVKPAAHEHARVGQDGRVVSARRWGQAVRRLVLPGERDCEPREGGSVSAGRERRKRRERKERRSRVGSGADRG